MANSKSDNSPRVYQSHSGSGDNIARDKIVNNNRTINVGKNYIENLQGNYIEQQNNYPNQPESPSIEVKKKSENIDLPSDKEIFISYAWGGESEAMAYALETTCKAKQIKTFKTVRDKQEIGYKGRITEFMQRLGRGKAIIIILSEKYLKSQYCMFELLEIAKNREFYQRIFPIVLQDSKIYDVSAKIDYINYWQEKEDQLNEKVKTMKSLASIPGITEELTLYAKIRQQWAELIDVISKMNNLSPEKHLETGFSEVINAIEKQVSQ